MFEKMKAFNAEHNGMPAKIAGAVVGSLIVGGLVFAVYNYNSYGSFVQVEVEPELLEDVVESTVKAAKGS